MTNEEKIRAMDKTELAKLITRRMICPPDTFPCSEVVTIKRCYMCWCDWLGREAKQ